MSEPQPTTKSNDITVDPYLASILLTIAKGEVKHQVIAKVVGIETSAARMRLVRLLSKLRKKFPAIARAIDERPEVEKVVPKKRTSVGGRKKKADATGEGEKVTPAKGRKRKAAETEERTNGDSREVGDDVNIAGNEEAVKKQKVDEAGSEIESGTVEVDHQIDHANVEQNFRVASVEAEVSKTQKSVAVELQKTVTVGDIEMSLVFED